MSEANAPNGSGGPGDTTTLEARYARAYESHWETPRAGDWPSTTTARKLHYCVRVGSGEDAFSHGLDLVTHFLTKNISPFALEPDPDARADDPPLVRTAALVEALERATFTVPQLGLAYTRLLAVLRALWGHEVRSRAILEHGIGDLLKNVRHSALAKGHA